MTIEELIQSGKTKEEILNAVSNAVDMVTNPNPTPEPAAPTPAPDPAPVAPAPTPAANNDLIAALVQNQMETNKKLVELQEQIINASKATEQATPTETPDEARQFSDEALTRAMQQLNLLGEHDKIDINKQVEDNLVSHLGSLVGFNVKGEERK